MRSAAPAGGAGGHDEAPLVPVPLVRSGVAGPEEAAGSAVAAALAAPFCCLPLFFNLLPFFEDEVAGDVAGADVVMDELDGLDTLDAKFVPETPPVEAALAWRVLRTVSFNNFTCCTLYCAACAAVVASKAA